MDTPPGRGGWWPGAPGVPWRVGSSQPPAEWEREREGILLLPIHPVELQPGPGRVLVDLRAGAAQIVGVVARHRDEPGEANFAMPRSKLSLAAHGGFLGLTLAGRI